MSWRDELRPASFRGVPFETRGEHGLSGGRRRATHEYPQRDEPYVEDMGRKARERKITAFVIGSDYMTGRDALIEALEMAGSGELVLPFAGRRSVVAGDFSMMESTEYGGMAVFTLSFTEAGQQAEPNSEVDADGQLAQSQETAFSDIADDFASGFDLSGLPAWSVDDIQSTVTSFLGLDAFKAQASDVLSIKGRLTSLLLTPLTFANTLIDLVRGVTDVRGIFDVPYIPVRSWRSQAVTAASAAATVTAAATATRGVVVQRQAAVNMLMHRAALVQETALIADLPTRTSVEAARRQLLEHFDAHDATPGLLRPSPVLAQSLRTLQVDALVALRRQAAALPQSYTLQLLQATPAVVLAYDLYQNLRAGEIVLRNGVRHPGFVPAGVPLEVSSQ
ncbi:DNA circularization protein [Ralstonia pseudosolanacearum]|uniref:DNA circularization protein n=1 Tax=Ralstonia pseudosolanacearum TaxID=1310165 RepID=UPI0039C5AE18